MKRDLVKDGIYRHYKNKLYRVIDIVKHSETLEDMVLYEALYESNLGRLWVRPKNMFLEDVTVGATIKPRFEFVRKAD